MGRAKNSGIRKIPRVGNQKLRRSTTIHIIGDLLTRLGQYIIQKNANSNLSKKGTIIIPTKSVPTPNLWKAL